MAQESATAADLVGLMTLLDDDATFDVEQWRTRNLRLYDELEFRGLIDAKLLPRPAHVFLTEQLIHEDNPAAMDPQNAGHIRAQNENILHYALTAELPKDALTIAMAAGFIHDLNKAVGEPLRSDSFAVKDAAGEVVDTQVTVAMSVGLNHLGQRTLDAIKAAKKLDVGALQTKVAQAIDRVIVHHGLGSSRFIRRLLDGDNEWWGTEYVQKGTRKLVHPQQPKLTLANVIHDIADSTQQMQGGMAWLKKYPYGFWKESGRSIYEMLSGPTEDAEKIPMSLHQQIEVETDTCREIVLAAHTAKLLDDENARRLEAAIVNVTKPSRQWVDASDDYLADPDGYSVYHDIARAKKITVKAAVTLLKKSKPKKGALQELLLESGRNVDLARIRGLATLIAEAKPDEK